MKNYYKTLKTTRQTTFLTIRNQYIRKVQYIYLYLKSFYHKKNNLRVNKIEEI